MNGPTSAASHVVAASYLTVDPAGWVVEADWSTGLARPHVGRVRLADLVHPADRASLTELVLIAVTTRATQRRLLRVRIAGQFMPTLVQVEDRLDEPDRLQVRLFGLGDGAFDLEALAELAFWDPLTGLANRVLFGQHLRTELQRGQRSGRGPCVLVADVNGLKHVNDRLGHRAGDLLLTEVGRRLAAGCRPSDIPSRLSGDEFAVLCPEVDTENSAKLLSARVASRVGGALLLPGGSVEVRVAVGWALSTAADLDDGGVDLIHRADQRMYGAKRSA